MTIAPADGVKWWLERFAASVRARDFAAGSALFDEAVFSFGTVAEVADGLDALRSRQWARVWPVTQGFVFVDEALRITCSLDGLMAFVSALWTSESLHSDTPEMRSGRATLVLSRAAVDDDWKAIHTHLSLSPRAQAG